MQHHRKAPFAGQPQVGAQQLRLRLTVGGAGEVEPRLTEGLSSGKSLAEPPCKPLGAHCSQFACRLPRVDARRAEFRVAPRRTVGVDIDIVGHDTANVGIFSDIGNRFITSRSDGRHISLRRMPGFVFVILSVGRK